MLRLSAFVLLIAGSAVAVSAASRPAAPATRPAATMPATRPVEMLPTATPVPQLVGRDPGYRGVWYGPARINPLLGLRCSGGLAFCPMEHTPVACHAATAKKTFFVYVGSSAAPGQTSGQDPPRIMVSYFDHATGAVPRPVVLIDNLPAGCYGCPTLSIDVAGRLWVFVSLFGTRQPGCILRSVHPYDISAWEKVAEMDFLQPQAWYVPGHGFMLVHCRIEEDRPQLFYAVSPDGLTWSKPQLLADFGLGHSSISGRHQNKIGVAFTYRTPDLPADDRKNLYYVETSDFGNT
ncbi:MAG: hypothetical protein HY718_00540, partial [Planctomycetes bacterium]|nr:hypothetical protein [Planctomycetota bacterium]